MFTKILIPTDGSVLGDIAAQEGIMTAAKLGTEVIGIYVAREYQKPGFVSPKTTPTPQEYEIQARMEGERILQPLENKAAQLGIKFTKDVRIANHIAHTILRAAHEHDCSLIFIGSNGCGGWDHILMGSVTSKVLSASDIPVLVYHLKKEEVPANTPYYCEGIFPPA